MGPHSYDDPLVLAYEGDTARVTVGAYCSLGQDVTFMLGGAHRVDWVTTFPLRARLGLDGAFRDGHPTGRGDIVVGSDVWIARDALVLSGVTIGDGAVVATRSVVTRDVRPYAIVAGNPAREIRRRFTDDQIDALVRLKWWEWPDDVVLDNVEALSSGDIDAFIDRHRDRLSR
jgi:acetyltransferase-like isoleucine patch superfamily enzyme